MKSHNLGIRRAVQVFLLFKREDLKEPLTQSENSIITCNILMER